MKYTEIKDRYGTYRVGEIIPFKNADTYNNGREVVSITREGRGSFRVITKDDGRDAGHSWGRQVFTML
jgi:hypothetical protein